MSKYGNVIKKEERKIEKKNNETKEEKVKKALKGGMITVDIEKDLQVPRAIIYRYKKELESQGYDFTKSRKKPRNEIERLQLEHNKFLLDIQAETGLDLKDIKLSEGTDPYHLILSLVKNAVVMTEIWENDGWREKYNEWIELGKPMGKKSERRNLLIHPRGLHYKIHSRYQIKKNNKLVMYNKYDNTHWVYCQRGLKVARQMGLIPYDSIKDLINPPPDNVPDYQPHDKLEISNYIETSDDVITYDFNEHFKKFAYKHIGETIKWKAESLAINMMKSVKYYIDTARPNHLELWCEKGEIIPYDIADKYNMEVRERGTGESSDGMCCNAVMTAKKAGKNLIVFELSDFDPAGENMPVSAGRKIQWYAQREDIQAFLYPVALNYRQIKEYELLYTPPPKKITYKGGYATRSSDFFNRWNMIGMMINIFRGDAFEGLKQEIENAVIPHIDAKFSDKIDDAKEELKTTITNTLRKCMRHNIHKLKNKRKRVRNKRNRIKCKNEQRDNITNQCETLKETDLKKYNDLETDMNEKYDELTEGFNERKDKYIEALKILEDRVIEKCDELTEPYDDRKEELEEAINILKDKTIKPYNDKRDEIIEELECIKTKKKNMIEANIKEYNELLKINLSEVLDGVEFKMPKADVSNGEDALLNTNRDYMEQLEIFREYKKKNRSGVES